MQSNKTHVYKSKFSHLRKRSSPHKSHRNHFRFICAHIPVRLQSQSLLSVCIFTHAPPFLPKSDKAQLCSHADAIGVWKGGRWMFLLPCFQCSSSLRLGVYVCRQVGTSGLGSGGSGRGGVGEQLGGVIVHKRRRHIRDDQLTRRRRTRRP